MSGERRTIAIDMMGADLGPAEAMAAVRIALDNNWCLDGVVLVGHEEILQPLLQAEGLAEDERVDVFHASEVIEMTDKPILSLKQKKDASMVRAIELVKLGNSDAAVSCGNTGALMACATLRLRPMEGIGKPALATVWPGTKGQWVFLDVGANPQARPENLVHNAVLGFHYAKDALEIAEPRVGLLSIGTEEGKGNDLVNEAHELLKQLKDEVNYVGLVEGFDLFTGECDVVVTDGFTGNIVLKSCEGLWSMLKGAMKEEFTSNLSRKMGAALLKPALSNLKRRIDPDRYAGAPLLGLRRPVIKTHGSANRDKIAHAIRIAAVVVSHELNRHSKDSLVRANQVIRQVDASAEVS